MAITERRTFRYTPADRFQKVGKITLGLLPFYLAPLVWKLYFWPDLRLLTLKLAGALSIPLFALGVRLIFIWKKVYALSINEEGATYSVNEILVSRIRWQDIRKVSDGDPYSVKLLSASSPSIKIESWMPIYAMTRRYVAEMVPADKISYVRYWARPMHLWPRKDKKKTRPTAAPGGLE